MHEIVGGAIALVSLFGCVVCLQDLRRWFTSQSAKLPKNEDKSVDYSGLLSPLEGYSGDIFEQTCHSEPVIGEGMTIVCESSATVASHAIQGLAHIVHH